MTVHDATPAEPLVSAYDTVLFDLDGVVYLGPEPVPNASETCAALAGRGTRVGFVTNNAARTPSAVAEHLNQLGIAAGSENVITSAQAVARMVAAEVGPSSPVLVLGAPALVDELVAVAGVRPVRSADDGPVAVVQGLAPNMTWSDLCEAATAIHRGARWFVTNTDTTRPTDRGLLPGCGAAVQALGLAVEAEPAVAGKPYPPLMRDAIERLNSTSPIFVGDRIDTDIAGAAAVGIESMLVLSGAHGLPELIAARRGERPSHLGADVSDLLRPARRPRTEPGPDGRGSVRCGAATVREDGGRAVLEGPHRTVDAWLDAAWALVIAAWRAADEGRSLDTSSVLAELGSVPSEERSRTVVATPVP